MIKFFFTILPTVSYIKIFSLTLLMGMTTAFAQSVKVVYPNGGERLLPNSSLDIKWSSSEVQNIKLEYSLDYGKDWNLISYSFPAFLGNYIWFIPDISSDQVIIKIIDNEDSSVTDLSDAPFSVSVNASLAPVQNKLQVNNNPNEITSTLTLDSPNPASDGATVWNAGSSQTISWTSNGLTTIDLDYSVNGGANWNTIQHGISVTNGSGNYNWSIPGSILPTTELVIRVKDSGGSTSDQNIYYVYIKSPQSFSHLPERILTIGNSITYDQTRNDFRFAQDKISYRYFLWNSLRNSNYNVDFIGDRVGGYGRFPDPETEGVPGINTSQSFGILSTGYDTLLQEPVTPGAYLDTYPPDVVLIHIGTNDIDGDIPTTVNNISSIINNIEAHDAGNNIWIVLALIIQKYPSSNWISQFNNSLNVMAQNRINNGERILVVNMENALAPSDYVSDGTHPDNSGKAIMANLWFNALKTILPTSSTPAPVFTSIPDTIAYVGLPYRYNVNVSDASIPPNYSLSSSPSGMTINQKTGIIDWSPTSVTSANVTVTATEPSGSPSSQQSFTIQVLPEPTLTNNLVSYWRMNKSVTEHSEATFEDLPGINNGSSNYSPGSVPGISGYGLNFSSTGLTDNETINVLDDSTLYFGIDTSFTIETWAKTTQSSGVFIGKYMATDEMEYWLGLDGTGKAEFFARCSKPDKNTAAISASVTFTNYAINDGSWHHVAGKVDRSNNTLYIYVDGISNSVSVTYNGHFFSYDPLKIGSIKNGSFFNGSLDEIAIYNRGLSGAEVMDHYNRGITYGEGYFDINARIKVFLQGPYPGGGTMNTTLNSSGYIPLSQPYNVAPWNYKGNESVSSIPNSDIVDWVLVQLRSGSTPATATNVVVQRAAFLKSDGSVVDLDGSSPVDFFGISNGSYYIIIEHRNHLAVISSSTVNFPTTSTYDFTASGAAYGTNPEATLSDGKMGMYAGDANGDGQITSTDFNIFSPKFYQAATGYEKADWNLDGQVTSTDFNIFNPNFYQARVTRVP